jgi:beta-phosphoglucomutase
MADEEGILFNREINRRLRGVSRMESLDIILEKASRSYTDTEKNILAARKNKYYVELISRLDQSALLPGAIKTVRSLRELGIKTAIGSSSKNAKNILKRVGIESMFDAVADGNDIKRSKPSPDVFLVAADKLGLSAEYCLVVEDADAGVDAALSAGMKVLAVGAAKNNPAAHLSADTLEDINLKKWITGQNQT